MTPGRCWRWDGDVDLIHHVLSVRNPNLVAAPAAAGGPTAEKAGEGICVLVFHRGRSPMPRVG
jgi:hypothetical protein